MTKPKYDVFFTSWWDYPYAGEYTYEVVQNLVEKKDMEGLETMFYQAYMLGRASSLRELAFAIEKGDDTDGDP